MRQINPIAKAWCNAERSYNSMLKGRVKWKKRTERVREFLSSSHKYERTFSSVGTGEFKVMLGWDAKELNDFLFEKYLAAVSRNKKGRSLERWEIVEEFVE